MQNEEKIVKLRITQIQQRKKIINKHVETIKTKSSWTEGEKKVDNEIDKRICIIHIFVFEIYFEQCSLTEYSHFNLRI